MYFTYNIFININILYILYVTSLEQLTSYSLASLTMFVYRHEVQVYSSCLSTRLMSQLIQYMSESLRSRF